MMAVRNRLMLLLPFIILAGCEPAADTTVQETESLDATPGATEVTADSVEGDSIALTPENTSIEFVGSHIVENGPDPDARHGSFTKFTGTATMVDGKLDAVQVNVDTASLETTEAKLTAHLKSPDFFDVREYPSLSFSSTDVETGDDGSVTITGDLAMLAETKSISFPATVRTDDGLDLSAEFTINRFDFGMTFGEDKIEKDVTLTVKVQNP